jgi:hypothetical protein
MSAPELRIRRGSSSGRGRRGPGAVWGGPGEQDERSHAGLWIWRDGTIAWGGGPKAAGRTGFLLKYPREGDPEFAVRDARENVLWSMPEGD